MWTDWPIARVIILFTGLALLTDLYSGNPLSLPAKFPALGHVVAGAWYPSHRVTGDLLIDQ